MIVVFGYNFPDVWDASGDNTGTSSRPSRLEDRGRFRTRTKWHHSTQWLQSQSPRQSAPCRNRTPISTFTPLLSDTDHTTAPISKLQHTRAKNDPKSLALFHHRSRPTRAKRKVSERLRTEQPSELASLEQEYPIT